MAKIVRIYMKERYRRLPLVLLVVWLQWSAEEVTGWQPLLPKKASFKSQQQYTSCNNRRSSCFAPLTSLNQSSKDNVNDDDNTKDSQTSLEDLIKEKALSALSQPTRNKSSSSTSTPSQLKRQPQESKQQSIAAIQRTTYTFKGSSTKRASFTTTKTPLGQTNSSPKSSFVKPKQSSSSKATNDNNSIDKVDKNDNGQNAKKVYNSSYSNSNNSKSKYNSSKYNNKRVGSSNNSSTNQENNNNNYSNDDEYMNVLKLGISSWEEFLGVSKKNSSTAVTSSSSRQRQQFTTTRRSRESLQNISSDYSSRVSDFIEQQTPLVNKQQQQQYGNNKLSTDDLNYKDVGDLEVDGNVMLNETASTSLNLPPIQDLFPPNLTAASIQNKQQQQQQQQQRQTQQAQQQQQPSPKQNQYTTHILDMVIPISDLFYQSPSKSFSSNNNNNNDNATIGSNKNNSDVVPQLLNNGQSNEGNSNNSDISNNNKINSRRNLSASPKVVSQLLGNGPTKKSPNTSSASGISLLSDSNDDSNNLNMNNTKKINRKIVRKRMEMLVGGVPVNPDPPQRAIELYYKYKGDDENSGNNDSNNTITINTPNDWASVITLNLRRLGPLLNVNSAPRVSLQQQGLFCEFFTQAAIKWDICPNDLREIVDNYNNSQGNNLVGQTNKDDSNKDEEIQNRNDKNNNSESANDMNNLINRVESFVRNEVSLPGTYIPPKPIELTVQALDKHEHDSTRPKAKGFASTPSKKKSGLAHYEISGAEFHFTINMAEEEILEGESDDDEGDFTVFKSVLVTGITAFLKDTVGDFVVEIKNFKVKDRDDGSCNISGEVVLKTKHQLKYEEVQTRMKLLIRPLTEIMDEDGILLVLATCTIKESRWSTELRKRIVDGCLFDDDDEEDFIPETDGESNSVISDDDDEPNESLNDDSNVQNDDTNDEEKKRRKEEFERAHAALYVRDQQGIYFDYSPKYAKYAPFQGLLGPRLVDAVVERAKQRHPRVIAIGDVHGCIDELQDLLRECDYRPGDLVVFLGDLVCKGPDSVSVVQMAREIGAFGVRGNHDFEVIRWHQAIESGVDPPVTRSEHYRIASQLGVGDMKWMQSLPWYINSKQLDSLFVHAGFVSGIRLAKQNPRLMMNMRSILPDGTVTSKFFKNWPWARLWDGPQTVLFGHDADRGLQQYEHAIGLDTGCVYGGRLTACILPERRLVSVSARKKYFKYRRKHYD